MSLEDFRSKSRKVSRASNISFEHTVKLVFRMKATTDDAVQNSMWKKKCVVSLLFLVSMDRDDKTFKTGNLVQNGKSENGILNLFSKKA
jgi:hypothetical protein